MFTKIKLQLKNFLRVSPSFHLEEGHVIEKAFIVGGIQYYHFTNKFELPHKRAFSALDAYRQASMCADRETLMQYLQAQRIVLSNPQSINILKLIQLNQYLTERVEFIVEEDTAWNLFAVTFFDANENPYEYDLAYGKKKIEHWKKNMSTNDFFLRPQIQELIPSLKYLPNDIETYFQTQNEIKKHHSKFLSSILSKPTLTTEPMKN